MKPNVGSLYILNEKESRRTWKYIIPIRKYYMHGKECYTVMYVDKFNSKKCFTIWNHPVDEHTFTVWFDGNEKSYKEYKGKCNQ